MPRPGIIQSSIKLSGIEPGTFRSSVWRSPNWAISASDVLRYRWQLVIITATRSMEFEKFIFDESAVYPFPTLFLNFSFNGKVQRTNNVTDLVISKNIMKRYHAFIGRIRRKGEKISSSCLIVQTSAGFCSQVFYALSIEVSRLESEPTC